MIVIGLLVARALADRLSHTPIIVSAVCPGYCYSGLRSKYKGAEAFFDYFMEKLLARTSEEGSRNILYGAVGGPENVDDLHGAYVYRCGLREPSDWVISSEGAFAQERIWVRLCVLLIAGAYHE